ncbi:TPA: TetR/AcrR family transcriptional regulator [Streptococcus pneumoniae]
MQESNKRLKTKRTIENAMVQLLMEQPFDKISTVKLVEKAGISRSSFYTHYKDKYDMSEPLLAALLSENGTKEIQNFLRNKLHIMLSTDLQKRFMQLNLNTTELEYSSIYLTHALFGVCQTWIAHGKKESSQEITDFLMKMLGDTN